ncbi:hypothetical protein E0Z10_g3772 [Xylaria hypoxylon]|uniref:DUF4604 domain-containing protein n=1 Tax=Xylaria hypoxylon TaxID=37992 RepID=A0A4Z0YM71_9PEZI|nr:hypothetical protein E0Z10_g3772 [Xylaria hypoxylon]
MSQKINSKNLTYDNSLPPFLARLRGQQTAHSGPDPLLAAHRRPGQKRTASEEAEDAPVVVDEDGNVVYLKDGLLEGEYIQDRKEVGDEDEREKADSNNTVEEDLAQSKEKVKVAGIGASRKRKVGRVIGEENLDDDEGEKTKAKKKNNDDEARIAKASADVRRLVHGDDETPSSRDNGVSADAHKRTNPGDDKSRAGRKPQQDGQQQKSIKSAKKKTAKKIKLSFGDNDDGE